jgi:hypothetical protein
VRRRILIAPALAVVASGCGGSGSDRPTTVSQGSKVADPPRQVVVPAPLPPLPQVRPSGPLIGAPHIRSPYVRVANKDDNAANLASAVVTFGFGQLPPYIDRAEFRLLPFEIGRPGTPGETNYRAYRLTVPHTRLVLDTAMTSAQSRAEVRRDAQRMRVDVTLDGRHVGRPESYWVYYRNNGPQICRIYFPDDLSSLQMAVNSMVWRPLTPGRHRLRVVVRRQLPPAREPARFVTDYVLRVLRRAPNAHEIALAPDESKPPPVDRTPLTFRLPTH